VSVTITKDTITTTFRAAIEDASPTAMRRLAKNLGVLGLQSHDRGFIEEKDPAGRPWRKHSISTIERRKKRYPGRAGRVYTMRILQSSGALRASVGPGRSGAGRITDPTRIESPGWASSARGAIRRAWEGGVEFGTNLIYAAVHQFGIGRRTATVRAHTRKVASRDVRGPRRVKIATGVAFVREHKTTLPAVPARPFVGLAAQLITRVLATIRMTFWRDRGGTR